ncbi:unnamed protein product [Phytomonas sp. Hart1]|nr:unnamed protein product [Phytomonas sp. Hart1]|eukprot:CCW70830.1 unnamed protein product [Phytomonas sp. isolate Hart1]
MQRNSLDILLLGEGNFTFTYSLVKKLTKSRIFNRCKPLDSSTIAPITDGHADKRTEIVPVSRLRPTCYVLATSFDPIGEVMEKYPESLPILKYFSEKKRVHVETISDVNATQIWESLESRPSHDNANPQLIIFNNPHIGVEDLYRHRSLLSHTFASIRALPSLSASRPFPVREAVIALCDEQPLKWGLLAAAARSGFVCAAAVPMLGGEFPDYAHARGQRDARFPYKSMVQYYFIHHADFKDGPELYTIIRHWGIPNPGKEDNRVSAPQFKTWCRIYEHFYGKRITTTQGFDFLRASDVGEMDDFDLHSLSLQDTPKEEEAWKCVPLVHPSIVFYTSAWSLHSSEGPSHGASRLLPPDEACFSPYLDVGRIVDMYRLQAKVERLAKEFADRTQSSGQVNLTPIPHHLDSRLLGRSLNTKEAAKLERYLRGYGSAKEGQVGTSLSSSPTEVYTCSFCPSPRYFSSVEARDHHIRGKHTGVNPSSSGTETKIGKQIIGSDSDEFIGNRQCELNKARQKHPESEYCSLCDLLFVDPKAFQEHLQFLTPRVKGLYVCTLCEPSESFVDERALLQHKTFKHFNEQ